MDKTMFEISGLYARKEEYEGVKKVIEEMGGIVNWEGDVTGHWYTVHYPKKMTNKKIWEEKATKAMIKVYKKLGTLYL